MTNNEFDGVLLEVREYIFNEKLLEDALYNFTRGFAAKEGDVCTDGKANKMLLKIDALLADVPDGLDRYEHKTAGYRVAMADKCATLIASATKEID